MRARDKSIVLKKDSSAVRIGRKLRFSSNWSRSGVITLVHSNPRFYRLGKQVSKAFSGAVSLKSEASVRSGALVYLHARRGSRSINFPDHPESSEAVFCLLSLSGACVVAWQLQRSSLEAIGGYFRAWWKCSSFFFYITDTSPEEKRVYFDSQEVSSPVTRCR